MTADDVRKLLADACDEKGSQRAFARSHDFSATYVNDVIRGRREPGESICAVLQIERVVSYRFASKGKQ